MIRSFESNPESADALSPRAFKYREAIIELHNMLESVELAPITWSELLEKAANDHRRDMTATGRMGATGSDGSSYRDRIERYCRWGGSIY